MLEGHPPNRDVLHCVMGTSASIGRVVIAGGSGFIGVSLSRHLHQLGYAVTVLSRRGAGAISAPAGASGVRAVEWDARTLGAWTKEIEGAAALINLTGRSVDCIKTPDHRDEILRSRVESTLVLGRALKSLNALPPVWVQMSTAHIYGDPPELICDEDAPFGTGLAPEVGRAWEAAFHEACPSVVRGIVLRTSFVIGRPNAGGTGALGRLGFLARIGLGGTIGHGRQGMSWIHETDMNRVFQRAVEDPAMCGAYIATSPNPVSNRDFMRALRRAVGMPIGLPAPAIGVRVAAPLLLRTDHELALYGRYCVPRRLRDAGFEFRFPELSGALENLFRPPAG